jgi:DNA-binding CsgD family transcriptional regulator
MDFSKQSHYQTRSIFFKKVKIWSDNASKDEFLDWEEQIKLLSEMGDLITSDLSLEEVIALIYASVNQLMDAYQFAVGLYDEKEGTILFKGMIENSKRLPDFVVNAFEDNRFAPWCIKNEAEIFINDLDVEYNKYVQKIPYPKVGSRPKAALYVPLRMNDKVVGLITVRTIHKSVYHKHHLYILKTLGNFVIKSLALSQEKAKHVRKEGDKKNWRWSSVEQLFVNEKKLLSMLTEREKDVLLLLVSGLPNKAIAEKLFVSHGTIKTHTLNIYQKMGVSNRTSAIMKAIELNWFV